MQNHENDNLNSRSFGYPRRNRSGKAGENQQKIEEMKPIRIQLSRKRGWKMPENTVKVDRTTAWGNPFKVGSKISECPYFTVMRAELSAQEKQMDEITLDVSVKLFRAHLERYPGNVTIARQYLVGKNLACWCKPGDPCHADVWLEKVNE